MFNSKDIWYTSQKDSVVLYRKSPEHFSEVNGQEWFTVHTVDKNLRKTSISVQNAV